MNQASATGSAAAPARDFSVGQWFALMMVVLTAFASQMAMPLWVGAVIDSFKLSDEAAGRIGSWEFGAVAIVSIVVGMRVQRYRVLPTVATGLVILILGNIGSALVTSELMLTVFRTVAGIGKGLMVAIAFALVAGSSRPTRAFAILNGGYSLYASIFYITMPYAIEIGGAAGAFWSMAIVAMVGGIFLIWFPTGRLEAGDISGLAPRKLPRFGLWATAALIILWIGHNAVWTFVERIGVHNGYDALTIGAVLSISSFLTIGGPALASIIDTRFGYGAPQLLAIVLKTAAIFLMVYLAHFWVFATMVPLFLLLTLFITPYVMGLLSLADPAGRLAGASSGAIAAGSSAGSYLGGVTLAQAGYVGLAWVAAALFLVFTIIIMAAAPSADRHERALANSA